MIDSIAISWSIKREQARQIQVDLVKLDSGERLLRLTDKPSGMALECNLNAHLSVARQTNRLRRVFEALLAQAELIPA
jgi:hypothetical protein